MEVECLAPRQRRGQCLLQSMTFPVFVAIKSLKFHNLSASVCHREKPARTHMSVENPFFLLNMRVGREKKKLSVW